MSIIVPKTPPTASATINKTGYDDFEKFEIVAFSPIAIDTSPNALNNTVLYFSFIPRCNKAPTALPTIIVHVFTIVPSI